MLYDKYTKINDETSEINSELSKLKDEKTLIASQLEKNKKEIFEELIQNKTEIRSGMKVAKIKSKDFKFRFKLFFYKLLWMIYN